LQLTAGFKGSGQASTNTPHDLPLSTNTSQCDGGFFSTKLKLKEYCPISFEGGSLLEAVGVDARIDANDPGLEQNPNFVGIQPTGS
jgi:hypothetical protein